MMVPSLPQFMARDLRPKVHRQRVKSIPSHPQKSYAYLKLLLEGGGGTGPTHSKQMKW